MRPQGIVSLDKHMNILCLRVLTESRVQGMAAFSLGHNRGWPVPLLFAGGAAVSLALVLRQFLGTHSSHKQSWIDSPRKKVYSELNPEQRAALPYPPDVLPGGRDVETPYGFIKVFEWGPESGEKVLIMHGIGTPCLALTNMAEELVENGYRVMIFDFFGRGFSDTPADLPFDTRLYMTQILLVLASSELAWTGNEGFHLIGYSLGGGVAASFAGYFPHLLRSLICVAGGGLIRSQHVSWRSKVLYSRGILPQWLLERLVLARLTPRDEPVTEQNAAAEAIQPEPQPESQAEPTERERNSDATGGSSFDHALLSSRRPHATVSAVMKWQVRHHEGFVRAFRSSIQHAPIYDDFESWSRLGKAMAARRRQAASSLPGLKGGKVLLVVGRTDPVTLKSEVVPDTQRILGEDAVEIAVLDCGHEIAIVKGSEVARAAIQFWNNGSS